MARRAVQLDRAARRRRGDGEGVAHQPRVQARGAPLAEARDEARLHAARDRRPGEDDDHRS
jgi:hypothetical protein